MRRSERLRARPAGPRDADTPGAGRMIRISVDTVQPFGRVRIMKVSKPYSATCHQRFPSSRKADCESRIFLKSGLVAEVSALTSFDALRQASMIGWLKGRSSVPFATRRLIACGLRASYRA